jgi:hypothetical protein
MNALEVGAGPFWVNNGPRSPKMGLPVFSRNRTSLNVVGMSGWCQTAT